MRPGPLRAAYPRSMTNERPKPDCPVRPLWRRLGLVAFTLFLLKGLAWLIVPALVATGWLGAR